MLHVRPADRTDAAPLAAILEDARITSAVAEPEALVRDRVRREIAACEEAERDIFVAEHAERGVLGFATVDWTRDLRVGPSGLLSDLFVHSAARGEGAGSALLARVEREARARGGTRLLLHTGRTGEAYERGFYAKKGFAEEPHLATFTRPLPPDGD
jgi:GNAT superfamily N-acetyltransferase